MKKHKYQVFSGLLGASGIRSLVDTCENFPSYHISSSKRIVSSGIGEGLPQRFDLALQHARRNSQRTSDIAFGLDLLKKRPSHFRAIFANGSNIFAPGIEAIQKHEGLTHAASEIYDCQFVEPAIVFANLMLPGQSVGSHTDVPEFRGANRNHLPEWLLVVMHHSGLFKQWQLKIATAVLWLQDTQGGAFTFCPENDYGPAKHLPARTDTAIVFDADSVVHGVERVDGASGLAADLNIGMYLKSTTPGYWGLYEAEAQLAVFSWEAMRASISWKAYCFSDERERACWQQGSDQLSQEIILDMLKTDLIARGRLAIHGSPSPYELSTMLVEEYAPTSQIEDKREPRKTFASA